MNDLLHQAALAPLLLVLLAGPGRLPAAYSLVALAFAVSWVGDSLAWVMGGSWAAFYVWVPVQIGIVLLAVVSERLRVATFVMLLVAAVLSAVASYPGPEVLVLTLGSTAAVLLVRGAMRWPIALYFGFGTLLYLVMLSGDFMSYWYAYQVSRMGAFLVFAAYLLRQTRSQNVHGAVGAHH